MRHLSFRSADLANAWGTEFFGPGTDPTITNNAYVQLDRAASMVRRGRLILLTPVIGGVAWTRFTVSNRGRDVRLEDLSPHRRARNTLTEGILRWQRDVARRRRTDAARAQAAFGSLLLDIAGATPVVCDAAPDVQERLLGILEQLRERVAAGNLRPSQAVRTAIDRIGVIFFAEALAA